jgi:hypothetical protein
MWAIHLTATSRVLKSLTSTVGFRGWVAVCGSGNEMDSPLAHYPTGGGGSLSHWQAWHRRSTRLLHVSGAKAGTPPLYPQSGRPESSGAWQVDPGAGTSTVLSARGPCRRLPLPIDRDFKQARLLGA